MILNRREKMRCNNKTLVTAIFPADQTDFADQESSYQVLR